jgi:hypothetical protein
MRAVLLFLVCGAALAAPPPPPPPATCASVAPALRAPCGQAWDGAAACALKGCCFDAANSTRSPCFYGAPAAAAITTVHVIQSCHFDAGYADFTTAILNRWFTQFFPQARELGLALAARDPGGPQLKFLAQSWVVSLYVDCPVGVPGLQCPSPGALANFSDSVTRGFVYWHALPHNGEVEMAGGSHLLDSSFNLTFSLDARFGLPRKRAISQRDVPGTTRGLLAHAARNGVEMITIGANSYSHPAAVARAFAWRDAESGTVLPVFYHPLGYGGIGWEDVVVLPSHEHAIVFDWRGDNAGPPQSVNEVTSQFAAIAALFPGAAVVASTIDDFAATLTPAVIAGLPVVEDEIGDTWVYGATADPLKAAWTVAVRDVLAECARDGSCPSSDPAVANATRFLVKNFEHTFGHDTKSLPGDYVHYSNSALQQELAANASKFKGAVASWVEQRSYGFDYALGALDVAGHPLAARLRAAFAASFPPPGGPDLAGFRPFAPGAVYDAGRVKLAFDAASGALSYLADSASGAAFAGSGGGSLLALEYVTFSNDGDYQLFYEHYSTANFPPFPGTGNFIPDFTKMNTSANARDVHQRVPASLKALYVSDGGGAAAASARFLAELAVGDATDPNGVHVYWGAPASAWLSLEVPLRAPATGPVALNATLLTYGKTPTRLSEGLFLRVNATGGADGSAPALLLDKLGAWIDPQAVVQGGCHKQHAVGWRGVRSAALQAGGVAASLAVASSSAMLVNVGEPNILPYPVNASAWRPEEGYQWLLSNNGWATNYPLWSPFEAANADQQWAFTLTLGAEPLCTSSSQ